MITEPFAILTLVLAIILVVPVVCRRLHIPSIVGLILTGILVGPQALGLIEQTHALQLMGQIGMLYIMLQAGIEIDVNDFSQYKYHSLIYGIYSFLIPAGIGVLTSRMLGFEWTTCCLMGAMYGSHTLMTYPIVSRYGVQRSAAVNITVGGTLIAITLSLLTLAAVRSHLNDAGDALFWWLFTAKLAIFCVCTLWVFPRVAQFVFRRQQDVIICFLLVMLLLVASAWLADWAGLESILGAFICGASLNRLVPNRSKLMNRINFVGNSIFVPLFLLGVGLIIDVQSAWSSWTTVLVALVMIATKLSGKALAAWLAQRTFHLQSLERQLIFGLTHATAAGTLAIVTIGYQIGLFNAEIVNAAVLMILILCTLSSFVTEHAAKQLALQEAMRMQSEHQEDEWLLMAIEDGDTEQLKQLSELSELHATDIAVAESWNEALNTIEHTSKASAIYHEHQPLNSISRLLVAVPRYAEKEYDFISCFGQIRRLSSQIGAKVVFYANTETQQALRILAQRKGKFLPATYHEMEDWEDVLMLAKQLRPDDMVVMLSARHATASYNPLFQQIPNMLHRFFGEHSYLLLYPEQQTGAEAPDILLTDQPQASMVWLIVSRIKQALLRLLRRGQRGTNALDEPNP